MLLSRLEKGMTNHSKALLMLAPTLLAGSAIGADTGPLNPCEYFSSDYSEARKKFLVAAAEVDAVLESHANPMKGPRGERLFTDVAILGPSDASRVLLVVSGTHGVEGFCGSGLQTGLLRSGRVGELPNGVKVVLVHVLNPFGMAWLRRVNEDNVDLNRNFIEDYSHPPENKDYSLLADVIAPGDFSQERVREARRQLLAFAENMAESELRKLGVREPSDELQAYAQSLGELRLRNAIHRGQYTHPKGLQFGGTTQVWSNKVFRDIVEVHVVGADRVVLIDLHTGLGPYGHGTCLLNEPIESKAYERARAWWGNTVTSTKSAESPSSDITGSLKHAFARMLSKDTQATAITLEFGTFDPLDVFFAMQAENWLHHYGDKNDPRAGQIKQEMLRVFYPHSDDHWKKMVWVRASFVVGRAIANLRQTSG
jgi:hypothetical protein